MESGFGLEGTGATVDGGNWGLEKGMNDDAFCCGLGFAEAVKGSGIGRVEALEDKGTGMVTKAQNTIEEGRADFVRSTAVGFPLCRFFGSLHFSLLGSPRPLFEPTVQPPYCLSSSG